MYCPGLEQRRCWLTLGRTLAVTRFSSDGNELNGSSTEMTGRSTAEELSGNVYTYSTHESICYAAATQFCSAFYNSNGSQYSSCFYHRNGNSSHEQTHLSLHLLGGPTASTNPHGAEVPDSEMQFDVYFSHVWLYVLLNSGPAKPLPNASLLQWDPHAWRITHGITLPLLSLLSSRLIFFLSKHLPSPNSGFWTRPVTIMMRREGLIASNASQDVRGRVATSPFSK